MQYLKIFALTVIIIGCFLGVRYISAIIHYNCAVGEEDCPPPFRIVAELGWVLTGGSLVPLWTRD